jgi:hypothetical protein
LSSQFHWAAVALFVTALPALVLAATQLSHQPSLLYVPWLVCSLMAGLWAFYEIPGHLRITASGFVTVAALATAGFAVAICCATITALASWASSLARTKKANTYLFLSNWATLVLSAAAGTMAFDVILGLPEGSDFSARLASNRFLLAFPAGTVCYVLVNTVLASLAGATQRQWPMVSTWKRFYSGAGMLFTVGLIQSLAFIVAFGSWGALGNGAIGTGVAFLIVLFLLGAGKQAVLQHETREHIRRLAILLRTVSRPEHRKHPVARYLLEDLLTQGTQRFLLGIPPEELTFEAEEAVLDAEIAWKLGASEQSIRSYLMLHETPEGTGPFGRKELPLPVWSPSFPRGIAASFAEETPDDEKRDWTRPVIGDLVDAASPEVGDLRGEHRKWIRLASSAARTVHSILERYDYGRQLNLDEDLSWWQSCELAGFGAEASAAEHLQPEGPEPLGTN